MLGDSLNPGETVDATPDTQSTPLDLARAQLDELTEQHVAAQKEALGPKFIAKSVRFEAATLSRAFW